MNSEKRRIISDMDGTLYEFDKGKTPKFHKSRFFDDIREKSRKLLIAKGLNPNEAAKEYQDIRERYSRQVSLGFEAEHGIDRYDFFAQTWGALDPENYIAPDERLPEALHEWEGKIALLTAAPRIWAVKVLAHLNITEIFGNNLYTGEPDLRKPNPQLLRAIATNLNAAPQDIFAVGDEEHSDITTAQAVGMKTIRIGSGETNADYQSANMVSALHLIRGIRYD